MKIVHVVDSLDRGGQETFLVNLSIEQKKSGHSVNILCFKEQGVLAEYAERYGVNVHVILSHKNSTFEVINKLSQLLKELSPNIIHTHNRRPLFLSLLAAPLCARKIINTRHGNGVRGLYWSLAACFVKEIINVSDDLLIKSNWVNRVLLRYKNKVIKNGILIGDTASRGEFKGKLIMVGRLNHVKNHVLALEVIKQCLLEGIDVSLNIVGEGEERHLIENKIKELNISPNVNLLGDRSDVENLLLEADIFLMTSLSEGHSIALLEACVIGLPAVVSNVGGNGEIVEHKRTGFVVELNDANGFVKAIKFLVENRNTWEDMSLLARKWAINNASINKSMTEYLDIYNR